MNDQERCHNCKFFSNEDIHDRGTLGTCHRFPPQHTEEDCVFPWVMAGQWCGEFVSRVKPAVIKVGGDKDVG